MTAPPDASADFELDEDSFWVHPDVAGRRVVGRPGQLIIDGALFASIGEESCPTCEYLASCDEARWSPEIAVQVQTLRQLLEDLPGQGPWTIGALRPLAHLFAPGEHRVARLAFRGDDLHYLRLPVNEKRFDALVASNASDNRMLVVPGRAHDRARVEYFARAIEEGRRPRLLTFSAGRTQNKSWGELDHYLTLVLDGHHKLEAYLETGVPIHVVDIMPETGVPNAPAPFWDSRGRPPTRG